MFFSWRRRFAFPAAPAFLLQLLQKEQVTKSDPAATGSGCQLKGPEFEIGKKQAGNWEKKMRVLLEGAMRGRIVEVEDRDTRIKRLLGRVEDLAQ